MGAGKLTSLVGQRESLKQKPSPYPSPASGRGHKKIKEESLTKGNL